MYRKRWIAVFLLLVSALSWATKPLPGWKALEPSDIEALFRDKTLGDGFQTATDFCPMVRSVVSKWPRTCAAPGLSKRSYSVFIGKNLGSSRSALRFIPMGARSICWTVAAWCSEGSWLALFQVT